MGKKRWFEQKERKEIDGEPVSPFDGSAFQANRCLATASRGCKDGRREKVGGRVCDEQLGAALTCRLPVFGFLNPRHLPTLFCASFLLIFLQKMLKMSHYSLSTEATIYFFVGVHHILRQSKK